MPEGITWEDAKQCSSIFVLFRYEWASGYNNSQYENDFIVNNLHPNYHWLGGFQPDGSAEPDGGWQWITGEPWDYTNWDSPEPNEYGNTGEDKLQIYANGYWNDISHTALNTGGYIVEYEPPEPPAPAREITVDNSKADFTSIQEAVNNSVPGDTIIVKPGTYTENVLVNVPGLTIRSESNHGSVQVKPLDESKSTFMYNSRFYNNHWFKYNRSQSGF